MTRIRRRTAALSAVGIAVAGVAIVQVAQPASAVTCPDVEVVFARGSGEMAGLGIVGTPLVNGIKTNLSGSTINSYAVNYAASMDQSSAGPGATDMTRHVVGTAKECPNTSFVLGGYSQGASVTDIAIGATRTLGTGETIPADLQPRIKAITVFGNPLRMLGTTIERGTPAYAGKVFDSCATGDPVCGGGANFAAHMSYPTSGAVTQAATFAAGKVRDGSSSTASPTSSATTTPTPTTSSSTPRWPQASGWPTAWPSGGSGWPTAWPSGGSGWPTAWPSDWTSAWTSRLASMPATTGTQATSQAGGGWLRSIFGR